MLPTLWQRLDQGARHLIPFISTLLFTLGGVVAWPLPYIGAVVPSLALMAVYYWAIHRPDLFGPGSACAIGLLTDILHGTPLGVSALVFVALHQLILSQRRFFSGQGFFVLWAGFAIAMVVAMLSHWLILSLIEKQMIPATPVLLQGLLSITMFPLPAWLFIRLQRVALSQG